MALSFVVAALAVSVTATGPQEPGISARWRVPARAVFAGEVVPIGVQIELPAGWVENRLVQLFARPLGLPLQVTAFERLPDGLTPMPAMEFAWDGNVQGTVSVALDGEIGEARGPLPTGSGSDRELYEISHWYHAPRGTSIALGSPRVQCTVAHEFREDFVQGRVPLSPESMDLIGDPLTLEIRPVPNEGRPLEFRGLVGDFTFAKGEHAAAAGYVGEPVTYTASLITSAPPPPDVAELVDLDLGDRFVETGGRSATLSPGRVAIDFTITGTKPSQGQLPRVSATSFNPATSAFKVSFIAGPRFELLPARVAEGATAQQGVAGAQGDPNAAANGTPPRPTPYWTFGVLGFVFLIAVASVIRRHTSFPATATEEDS